MIYLATFAIATILAYIGGTRRSVLLMIASALFLSALAGARSDDMGVDIGVYVKPEYYAAQVSSLGDYTIRYLGSVSSNVVYHVYSWLAVNAFKDFNIYLLFLSLAQILPTYYSLYKLYPKYSWVGVLTFECVFYCFGFNIVKQCIAMSLLLVAYCHLKNNKPIVSLFCFAMAFGCHEMAIIGIVIYPVYYLMGEHSLQTMQTRAAGSLRLLGLISFVFVMFAIFIGGRTLLVWLVESTGDYGYQVRNMGSGDVKITYLIYVSILVVCYVYFHISKMDYASVRAEVFLSVMGGIAMQLSVITPQAYRVGMFLLIFSVIAWPALCSNCASRNNERSLCIVSAGVNVAFFVYVYLISGAEGLFPYRSDLLPFFQF